MAQINIEKCGIRLLLGYEMTHINFADSGLIESVGVRCLPNSRDYAQREEIKEIENEKAKRKSKQSSEASEMKEEQAGRHDGEFFDEGIELYDELIRCGTLLHCANMQADIDVFSAVNDSGLVYDGGIVVDGVHSILFLVLLFS